MLPNKSNSILSEVKEFFTSSEKATNEIFEILRSLKFCKRSFKFINDNQTGYKPQNIVLLLLLFPLLQIKNAYNYSKSPVYYLCNCGKDVFYRLKNNEYIDWRLLLYKINLKLISKAAKHGEKSEETPTCLIVDDTDLPKSGFHVELIGRVWSHVMSKSILGYKGLFMGYFDGKSFFGLDFSLHGEKGKNNKKPYGLSKKQQKARYSKKRNKESAGKNREQEYFLAKTIAMLNMISVAINKGIRFEYLLIDSWFMSESLINFILKRKIKSHLLGMAKMGNTRYTYNTKELTAKEIVEDLKRKKKIKKSKCLNVWYSAAEVLYKEKKVKLLFCKTTHKGKWNVLLTTNMSLEFEQAYKIYSIRWSIEVFFKECKQYLSLGKSQSQNFNAQIADTTISILQFNILSLAKRFLDYESLGVLFQQAKAETLILTLAEQIWKYLIEILTVIAEVFEIDIETILENLLTENQAIMKLINIKDLQLRA